MPPTLPLSLQPTHPLTYHLPNTHLQDHLSYIDPDTTQLKSKIAYMIKLEQQQSMEKVNPYGYIEEIKLPETPFMNSERFMKEVERVRNRLGEVEEQEEGKKETTKGKKVNASISIDQQKLSKSKLPIETLRLTHQQITTLLASYQQSLTKNITLQTSKQFSPLLLKEMIQSLQTQKSRLRQNIEKEREEINEINRLRKYEQLEAGEKEEVVGQRVKLMVNKRRKLE